MKSDQLSVSSEQKLSFSNFSNFPNISIASIQSTESTKSKTLITDHRSLITPPAPSARASSLVTTLLVLAVISIVVIAFLQSMGIERLTASSATGILRAELAAQSATEAAIDELLQADTDIDESETPDGAGNKRIVFSISDYRLYTVAGSEAPYLTMVRPNQDWTAAADTRVMASFAGEPTAASAAETVDINAPVDRINEPLGWIGLAADAAGTQRRKVPVQWIYLTDNNGKQIARYAFWVDDESARLDISQIGLDATTHERKTGGTASDISIHGLFANLGDFFKKRDGDKATNEPSLRDYCYGLLGWKQLVAASGAQWRGDFDALRASIAWETKPDERGSLGYRRLDINDWVDGTDSNDRKRDDYKSWDARDRLAKKVVAMGRYINEANRSIFFPNDSDADFGTRFYGNVPLDSSVSKDQNRLHYCVKIAANIQDYIDEDSQPTVIRHDLGGWQEPPDPTEAGAGTPEEGPPAAFGKEVVPAIGEYVNFLYGIANNRWRTDHTFEIWNIHTKPIDFAKINDSNDLCILIANRPEFTKDGVRADMPGMPDSPPLVFSLPAGTPKVESGRFAIVTTLPNPVSDLDWQRYDFCKCKVTEPQRISIERELEYNSDTADKFIGVQGEPSAQMEIVITNKYGYLDIQPRVPTQRNANLNTNTNPKGYAIPTQPFGNIASDFGNNTFRRYPLDSGDPRSLTEIWPTYSDAAASGNSPIAWRASSNLSSQNTDKFESNADGTVLGGDSYFETSGKPGIWPANDYAGNVPRHVPEPVGSSHMKNGAADAVSVIRDGHMKTIGELGFIYDPAISGLDNDDKKGYYNSNARKRGGFRTLTIGSRMGEDLGPANLVHVDERNRASRLLELFDVFPDSAKPNTPPPRVLLNSVLRNPSNIPLRAVVENLNMQSSDKPFGGANDFASPKELQFGNQLDVKTDNLIEAMRRDAATTSRMPFFYLGQIATRLDIFNEGSGLLGQDITGDTKTNKKLMDHGREEVFRRLCGSLCMKGTKFRIYAIGQAGTVNADGTFTARSTSRLVTVVELERQYERDGQPVAPLADTSMPAMLENNTPIDVTAKTLLQLRY